MNEAFYLSKFEIISRRRKMRAHKALSRDSNRYIFRRGAVKRNCERVAK